METVKLGPTIDELIEEIGASAAELPVPVGDKTSRRFYSAAIGGTLLGLGVAALTVLGFGYLLNRPDMKQADTSISTPSASLAAANITLTPTYTPTPVPPTPTDTPTPTFTPIPPTPTYTPTPIPPTPTDTPTITPTPTDTPVPPKQVPIVETAKPGHYWTNRSVTQGIGGPSLSFGVESIDVLADGKMRLNYYTYNNTCCNWDFAGPRGSYLVDNFGKKYDFIDGAGGGTASKGQRVNGWMLFPALQPNASSFSLKYDNRYEIDRIEFISPERHTLNLGNYGVNKSSSSRLDKFVLTLESVDVLEGGRMRLNVSIYNELDYNASRNTARGTHIVDNSGRRYDAIYGSGSVFETFDRMTPKERIRGWMFFPSLIDGQTEATLNHPDYKPITFSLRRG